MLRTKRFVPSLLALTSFGSYNSGHTVHSVHPNSAKVGFAYLHMLGDIAERFKKMIDIFGIMITIHGEGGSKCWKRCAKLR